MQVLLHPTCSLRCGCAVPCVRGVDRVLLAWWRAVRMCMFAAVSVSVMCVCVFVRSCRL